MEESKKKNIKKKISKSRSFCCDHGRN
uniref:Uncharacterized protein n=1 Tax=Anguilla anguilla TaxID=7936 RepID=A0A0E9VYF8_ANGAN